MKQHYRTAGRWLSGSKSLTTAPNPSAAYKGFGDRRITNRGCLVKSRTQFHTARQRWTYTQYQVLFGLPNGTHFPLSPLASLKTSLTLSHRHTCAHTHSRVECLVAAAVSPPRPAGQRPQQLIQKAEARSGTERVWGVERWLSGYSICCANMRT